MKGFWNLELNDWNRDSEPGPAPRPRAVGSPLPVGPGAGTPPPRFQQDEDKRRTQSAPARAFTSSPAVEEGDPHSGVQRILNAIRSAIPLAQTILPALEGRIAGVSNSLSHLPSASNPPTPRPSAGVDLAPIEHSLAELQTRHRELRDRVAEQNAALKRVEDELEMVREAADRNTLEQREFVKYLRTAGSKVKVVSIVAILLLAISILLDVVLLLRIQRVLP